MLGLNWIVLAVLTAIFFGLQSVLIKILTRSIHQFEILKYLFLIASLFLLPLAVIFKTTVNFRSFIPPFVVSLVLNIFSFYLLTSAIKSSPISIVMPFVGLTPLFLILTSFIILGEKLSSIQFLGIIFIVSGSFILQLPTKDRLDKNHKKYWIYSIINLKEKGIGQALLVAFLWSITANVEKLAVLASSPEFYGASIHFSLGLAFVALSRRKININYTIKKAPFIIILLGIVSAALAISQLTAIKIAYVSKVISFKRAGIFISSLFGFVYFKEGNYLKSLLGTLLILGGAYILI